MTEQGSGGRPRQYGTPEAMQLVIEEYFYKCDSRIVPTIVNKGGGKGNALLQMKKPKPYTVQGLAVYLNLTFEGLREYGKRPEFSATVKNARARIEENAVTRMLDGDGPVAAQIFNLKNNFDWKDKKEISGPGGGPIVRDDLSGMTNEELEKRLKLLTGGKNAK